MECETQPQLDPSLFEKNIAALREVDAALAERLAGLPIAPAEPAVGRDGSVTFRLPDPNGEPQWFGRTSMPTVSGPAMLDCFNHAGNNVALPGIGQGIEARLLTDRLAAHRAVFVLEPDARRLALALRVHDLAAPLQSGKLVLLTGDDLAEQLGDFLAQSAGYVIPDRLLSWPWLVPGDIESCTAVLQQGSAAALHRRTAALADLERELAAAAGARTECAREGSTMQSGRTSPRGNPFPPPTALVGLALHPSPSTARRAAELADAAAQAGLTWHHCIADAPAHGHALAHLHVVAKRNPERLLLLDHTRGDLPPALPAGLPAVSWLDAPGQITDGIADRIGADDVVCVTCPHLLERLAALGVHERQRRVVPLGAAAADFDPLPDAAAVPDDVRCDVAIFADGANLDPEVWGVRLESHRTIYNALVESLAREGHRFCAHRAESQLARVEKNLGLPLGEPQVRTVLCRQIEQVIAPTTCVLALVRTLNAAGLCVNLYGRGWETHDAVRAMWRGPIDDPATEHRALAGCRVVVHADPTGAASRQLFHAAAAGRPILARAHAFDHEPGGLATLFAPDRELLPFSTPRDAATLAARLLADADLADRITAAARVRVQAEHMLCERLAALSRMREGGSIAIHR